MDLFTLISSQKKRHQFCIKLLADKMQKSEKTIKRMQKKPGMQFDIDYWKIYGEIKEEEWNTFICLRKRIEEKALPLNREIRDLPNEFRQIFPLHLNFLLFAIGFKWESERENDTSSLIIPAMEYIIVQTIAYSNIVHSLFTDQKEKYDRNITRLLLPFSIPDQEIWNSRDDTDFLEQKFMELGKLGILTFVLCIDIAFLGWQYPKLKELYGDSMLIGKFLKHDKTKTCREDFFQANKNHICDEKNIKDTNKNFYKLLIGENINDSDERIDAIRKLCTNIRRGKLPTSEALNEFIEKVYKAKGEQFEFKTEQERIEKCILVRTQYALSILVDDLYRDYCVKEKKELSTFIYELKECRSWLYKNVFGCPIPATK